jgi:selenocysteine-specific elongation factor
MILRFYSPVELLGGARVAELDPPRGWVNRTRDWAACLGADPVASFGAAVRLAGGRGIDRDGLRLATPHPASEAPDTTAGVRRIGDRWFDPARVDQLEQRLVSWLGRQHEAAPRTPALPLESLRAAAAEDDADALVGVAIERLQSAGLVVVEGPEARLAEHEVELSGRETEVREALLAEIRGGGLMPPTPAELSDRLGAGRALVNDLLRLVVEAGRIVQVTPELYITADAEATLRRTALEVLDASDAAPPTEFREALGATRRYLIPLLEYLDNIGWTRRTGEGRIAGPAAEAARR